MTATSRLQTLDEQIERLRQQRAAVAARERERERKRDARRKVLLGAGLLALVRNGDTEADHVYGRIRAGLDARAAKPFDGWKPARDGGAS